MKSPDDINTTLLEPFPQSLIEEKNSKRYIGHEHIRMRVIEATGNQFDWTVTGREIRDQDGVIRARKSGTIPPVMIVDGVLTIPGLGARAGTGVQVLEENAGEDTYKAAESDAFKRAAMAFGVGLQQLYMDAPAVPQQVTARATSPRPQTRQQREELTDKQFDEEVRKALKDKNNERFAELVSDAGKYTSRWLVMIRNCESPQALDWLERRCAQMNMLSTLVADEIAKKRTEMGE